jgi:hypothetical protein
LRPAAKVATVDTPAAGSTNPIKLRIMVSQFGDQHDEESRRRASSGIRF